MSWLRILAERMERRFEERLTCFEDKILTAIHSAKETIMLNLNNLNQAVANVGANVQKLTDEVTDNFQTAQQEIAAIITALGNAQPGDQAAIDEIAGRLSTLNETLSGNAGSLQATTDALKAELNALTPPPPNATGNAG